jgi:hypothetical protein
MKKILIILGILLASVSLLAVSSGIVYVYNSKSFTTSEAAGHDTSSTIDISTYDKLYLVTSVSGTDSVKLKYYVDGLGSHSKWDLNIYNDSLIVDNGSGDYSHAKTLFDNVSDNVKGFRSIRVRCDVSSGAADDSSSALIYTQYLRYVK